MRNTTIVPVLRSSPVLDDLGRTVYGPKGVPAWNKGQVIRNERHKNGKIVALYRGVDAGFYNKIRADKKRQERGHIRSNPYFKPNMASGAQICGTRNDTRAAFLAALELAKAA